ncbi:MazG family protein [Pseudonocardia sp. GCM10023141]|uniref:MazG family protein n=1 Tax=Pseudonocardia sp. GCM10023141 TaxID=3252653 RepID=UPI00360E8B0D
MSRTVVVLPLRWTGVLPAAAVPALRAATALVADATVPVEVLTATGAIRRPGPIVDGEVLLTSDPQAVEADVVVVAEAPAGAALLDAVAVMDTLRSPGGCPWDAEQTPESLLQYLVEECYELYQAIEDGDRVAVREELGDVLLQVLFHARIATEQTTDRFGIDEVAGDLVTKLVGRHPHVFAGTERIETAERQEHRWEELKRAEKQRESSVDGVATSQPAVALAAKLTSRTARAGLPADHLPSGSGIGDQLFALAARAKLGGVDPEAELRRVALQFAVDVREAERAAVTAGADPHTLDAAAWKQYWPR